MAIVVQFKTKETEEYFNATNNASLSERLDNAISNARFHLNLGVKTATTRKQYKDACKCYLEELDMLKYYGIFSV